jgi:hypothetical protein
MTGCERAEGPKGVCVMNGVFAAQRMERGGADGARRRDFFVSR